jgi:SAM-dependent methyltransferase
VARPAFLGRSNADAFLLDDVACAYHGRPAYPEALIDALLERLPAGAPRVLELGCGTGELSRRLALRVERVQRVDAVDVSQEMLRVGGSEPGGVAETLHWHCAPGEDFVPPEPPGLVVTADSIHWMEWERLFPRLVPRLAPRARLAVVSRDFEQPWQEELTAQIVRFSVIEDWEPFDAVTGLVDQGYLELEERVRIAARPVTQSLAGYLDQLHSMASLARPRLGERSAEFDREVCSLLEPWLDARGELRYAVGASVAFGIPRATRGLAG